MSLYAIIVLILRHQLGKIFSPDAEVVSLIARLCPIMALYQVREEEEEEGGVDPVVTTQLWKQF